MTDRHVNEVLDELLVAGGALTVRLLGGEPRGSGSMRRSSDGEQEREA